LKYRSDTENECEILFKTIKDQYHWFLCAVHEQLLN
jgi:hypothetical protein